MSREPPETSALLPRTFRARTPWFASRLGRLGAAAAAMIGAGLVGVSALAPPTRGAPLQAETAAKERPACEPDRPDEPVFEPLSREAHARAKKALDAELQIPDDNTYAREAAESRRLLALLGLDKKSDARIHIEDVNWEHGSEVVRAAAGRTSLAQGAEITLNTTLPNEYYRAYLSAEQRERIDDIGRRLAAGDRGELTSVELGVLAADRMHSNVYYTAAHLARIREAVPDDGRWTFVNLSWGVNPVYFARDLAEDMMRARKGSKAYREATVVLGHEPRVDRSCRPGKANRADRRVLMKKLLAAIRTASERPEHLERMLIARAALEHELALGRTHGIFAFTSAGNEHDDAIALTGHPDDAIKATAGIDGLIEICASTLKGLGPEDDRIVDFSVAGEVCAPGADLPLEANGGKTATSTQGTSFASPIALEIAETMHAQNPGLTHSDLEALLTDPRATRDLPDTERDGAGNLDPFAAVVLAVNPELERTRIEDARASLLADSCPESVARVKASLGLGRVEPRTARRP